MLTDEVIEYLALQPGERYLDCTVGSGGHSAAILKRIIPNGKLIGLDQDEEMLSLARERLKNYKKNLELIRGNFSELKKIISENDGFAGILYDLGLSLFQILKKERGFSFMVDGPLDMRMNQRQNLTAEQVVNESSEEKLIQILKEYGEEYYAPRIVSAIIRGRKSSPISTTFQLKRIVTSAVPKRKKRIHPATKTFQALRIAVNRELESLEGSLPQAINLLEKKGRILVISFHSLEDRIVKQSFRKFAESKLLKIITRSPLIPTRMERCVNPHARSAKLRVAEKL